MSEASLFLRAKLDWASGKSLTTTPSSLEYLLLTSIKEDLCQLGLLLTISKFKTLITGISKLHQ